MTKRTQIEAAVFLVVCGAFFASVLMPSLKTVTQANPAVDVAFKEALKLAVEGKDEEFAQLFREDVVKNAPPGSFSKITTTLKSHGDLKDVALVSFRDSVSSVNGEPQLPENRSSYSVLTSQNYVFNIVSHVQFYLGRPRLLEFQIYDYGPLGEARSLFPSGYAKQSRSAWTNVILGYVVGFVFILIWIDAAYLIYRSQSERKWLYGLLLFVFLFPTRILVSDGSHITDWMINVSSVPVWFYSESPVYPFILQLKIPVGAIALIFILRRTVQTRISDRK